MFSISPILFPNMAEEDSFRFVSKERDLKKHEYKLDLKSFEYQACTFTTNSLPLSKALLNVNVMTEVMIPPPLIHTDNGSLPGNCWESNNMTL